jgi:hypothetical protein
MTLPIQFRRSQDFYISSNLELNCADSLSIITKWTISSNCNSTCSLQVQLDQPVITTFSELFIPARTLTYGIYELKLTVTMIASPALTSSASAYVKIISSDITANLVKFGTQMITHGCQQDLILDPGTFSVDPDATTFNASVSDNIFIYFSEISSFLRFIELELYVLLPTIRSLQFDCLWNTTTD